MTDFNIPAADLNAPLGALDAESLITIVAGLSIAVFGVTIVLQVPQAREACGRLLGHPEVRNAGRAVARVLVQAAAAPLGMRVDTFPAGNAD